MFFLSDHTILIFLLQVLVILTLARSLGELFGRWKQPALTGEILVGVLLGPTILGRFFPQASSFLFPADPLQKTMLETLAWLGVFFLLLESGLEIDFSSAWRQRGDALKIALSDIIIPMVIAFVPAMLLPDTYLADPSRRLIFALFIATVMTISALPISARALHDLRLIKTDLGLLVMSALSVNDLIGWLIFTIILGVFTHAGVDFAGAFGFFLFAIGFGAVCLTFGRKAADRVISWIHQQRLPEPASSLTFICLLGFFCGSITHRIGIHALFGFFIAGMMAGGAPALPEKTRQIISQMVYALFVPLFFVNIGLKVDFWKNFDLFLVIFFCLIGVFGRFYGAWFGVNLTRIDKVNRSAIAICHIPGGVMEIVVSMLALQFGLISERMFVAIVFSAVFSSVILGPWLNYAIRKRKRVSIMEFFSQRTVVPLLKPASRDEALLRLCEVFAEQEGLVDVDPVYRAVLEREKAMGTALEEGLAVPHGKLAFIDKPSIVVGRSLSGIEWNSPDGKPAQLIFLIFTPASDDVQVQILSTIARAMSEPKNRQRLLAARDAQDLWESLQETMASAGVINRRRRHG